MMLQKLTQELKRGKTLLQFSVLKGTGQTLGMLAPLIIAKLFVDTLGKEAGKELYGSYSLAKMLVFLFSTLLIASSQTPFVVFANQERSQTGRINKTFSVQLSFFILSFLIFFALVLPFNRQVAKFAEIDPYDLVFVVVAFVGLTFKTFLCNLFMALGQRIKNSLVEFVFGVLTLALVLILYITGSLNLRTVFLVYLISGLAVVLTFISVVDFSQLRPFGIDRKIFRDMLRFTKWLLFGQTAVYLINWGDLLVLRLFAPLGDIGTYNLGYQVFKGILMLLFTINAYFLPFVSQYVDDSARMGDYLFNKRPKILLLGLTIIGVLFLVSPYVFKLVYGESFQGAVPTLRILLIAAGLMLYAIFYHPLLNALKKYKVAQAANITQVLVNLLLDFLLVPVMGILGAAVATVLAYFCHAVIIEMYFRIRLKKTMMMWKEDNVS